VHFIFLSHPYTTLTVAQAFFDGIVKLHGFHCSIVRGQDPVSPTPFGRSSSPSLVCKSASTRLFVCRSTANLRSPTKSSVSTCVVSPVIVHVAGSASFRGRNSATTRRTRQHCKKDTIPRHLWTRHTVPHLLHAGAGSGGGTRQATSPARRIPGRDL
jgi:hypothetical protein